MATVNLKWLPRFEADHFRIYRSTSLIDPASLPAALVELGPNSSFYTDTTAELSTRYFYLLAAVVGSPEQVAFTEQVQIWTGGDDEEDPEPSVVSFTQYYLGTDYTIAADSTTVPDHTTLELGGTNLFDAVDLNYVVDSADNNKFAALVHSAVMDSTSGHDIIVGIRRARAATPSTFEQISWQRQGSGTIGLPVTALALLKTGDIYEFFVTNDHGTTSPTFSASDVLNAISIELLEEV